MILENLTPLQRQLILFTALLMFLVTLTVLKNIWFMQFLAAQTRAYNALATAIEDGAPVTIPITLNIAKFPMPNGSTDN